MITRLLATQITWHWDVIKHSMQQVERIGCEEAGGRFNSLFASLLSDKSQCFIKHEDGQIHGVMVTEIHEDDVTKDRSLRLRSLYAYKPFSNDEWVDNFNIIRNLANSERCSSVVFESKHPKIIAMAQSVGFVDMFTTMKHTLGG